MEAVPYLATVRSSDLLTWYQSAGLEFELLACHISVFVISRFEFQLSHVLVFSTLLAKGLYYDEVILYRYFSRPFC